MDYDDNDAQEQNLHLTGEGSSKVSPVLHSYPLPKFDFDDNLQEHLRFDSLVENEVFLGITSQEDNQWIEEYSQGPSAIPFNSSVAESRSQNVWSEATSSESVEMLLKSVGQEEKVLEETMAEELDPNLKQCDGNDQDEFQENFIEQSHVTFTSQSQETHISPGELDSVVVSDKYGLSFGDKKADNLCDDANPEGSNLADEMQEDPSVNKVECGNADTIQNVDASVEECQESPLAVPETLNENETDLSVNYSNESEHIDKICDDANHVVNDLANEPIVVELQEDPFVSKVECGNAGSSQNVNASVEVLETHNENTDDLPKSFHSSAPEHIDNISDDANEEGNNLGNKSFANESQEDLSVSKVEGGIAGSSLNVDASVENPQEVLETPIENTDLSKNFSSSEPGHIHKIHDDAKEEDINLADESFVNELQEDPSVSKVEEASIEEHQENEHASDLSKNFHSSEAEHVDKLCDDVNQKGSDLGSESFVNELQDLSASKVEDGVAGSSQNVDASVVEGQDNTQEVLETGNENASDLNFHNSEPEHIAKISDDANQEGSNLASESLVNELQEDPSVSKVEGSDNNNVGSTLLSTNSSAEVPVVDISSEDEGAENNAPNIDTKDSNQSLPVNISNVVKVGDETQSSELDAASMDQDFTFSERGDARDPLESKDMDIDEVEAPNSQKNVEPSLSGNATPNIDTEDSNQSSSVKISGLAHVGDKETQSLEPEDVSMDQGFTFNERGDTTLHLDYKDTDMDVDRAHDTQKNDESSLSTEVCEEAIVMTQISEPDIVALPDAVADVESSKISSPVTQEADIVAEDQPRSPILGVSLLHDDNKEKVEVGGNCQKGAPQVDSSPLPLVKKDSDSHDDLPVGSSDVGPSEQTVDVNQSDLKCSKPLETTPLSYDLSEEANNADAGGLLDPKESMAGEGGVEPLNLTVNISNEQQASVSVAVPSVHETEGGSASLDKDKPQIFSFLDTKSIEPSQSAKDKHEVTKGTMENTPLSKISNEGYGGLLSVSSSSARKEGKSFTFEVTGQTGIQNIDFSKVSPVSSSGGLLDSNKPHQDTLVTPQTPSVAPVESGAKKTSERKPRRKSVGKETAKKGNHSKETTPTRRSGTEKSPSPLITSENQPDLNIPTSIPHQSFTDIQQVQLRAQILVYGSLISGMSPEEPHMIAAFGQSDPGRKAWEAAWHACIERVHGHKTQVNNPLTPLQSRSANRDPEQETKTDTAQSKVLSTPIITGSIVSLSPMNPIPSPLWNISTPHDRLQTNPTPRSAIFDYRQTLSPLHPFQAQRVQTFAGHNQSWPSQGPFPGQWLASSPLSPFNARFSSLPITESVKLTTVKESGAPGLSVTPVDLSSSPIISPIPPSSISHIKNTIVSSSQPSNDSKTRKRKKPTPNIVDLTQTPVSSPPPPPVPFSTPVSITPKTNQFLSALSPETTHGQPKPVDRNTEKTVTKEEIMTKIEESKLQATEAAEHAAVAVTHCQHVWSQLERQKSSGLASDDEAKLASSAVSIAAAASVAKVAAYAAKIASNVAEQARLMADEVLLSSRTETHKTTTPASVISVAREAARKRIEAASAASKHAENLDAIVKAAELAAEAVSQAGKIVAMGKPLAISELVEAGPEGYWKTPQASKKQNVEAASSDKKIQTLKHDDLFKNQMMITSYENDKSTARIREGIDLTKTIGAVPDLEIGPSDASNAADVDMMPQSTSPTWKDNNIKEGCLVEVYKDDNKNKGAWFAANVLTLKDGKAFVCYTEIPSDEGSGKLMEWVPLEVEGTEAPRIRIAHPLTTMRFEGSRKRGRTVFSDYAWCSGDQVDVWVQDSWHEAIVVDTNKIDLTSLTVQFPAQGKTSIVRSWHVRPTLVWKDDKWIEWSSLKGRHSSEGDTPQEKRQKFDKEKDKAWNNIETSSRHQESRIPTFSSQNTSFDIGKTSMDDNKQKTRGPMRSGFQKERSRVVFGVPKPGKKQKFMDVSKHYVGDGSSKNNNNNTTTNINPLRKIFTNESKEKQIAEAKSKPLKTTRKPPIPTIVRTLAQKDKSKPSVSDKNVSADENMPGQQQKDIGFGSSSSSSKDAPLNTPKQSSTSKKVVVSERLNKRKIPSGNDKSTKLEVKENLTSESEPRRSNRKIQPTSRLLEGLQSSLTISKMPTVSYASQRNHNKGMSKGSPRPG